MIFDWFKSREERTKDYNVVQFPKPVIAPPEKKPETYYTFGLTDDNRLSFTMGYATLTMNHEGIQQLIDHLEFFKNQLEKEVNDD